MPEDDDDDFIIEELLLLWDELRGNGQQLSPIDLCGKYPHLIPEVERRIELLKAMEWIEESGELSDTVELAVTEANEARTISQRYRMEQPIGEGGFGQVWRAYDIELQRDVALKIPKSGGSDSAELFIAEARRVARLRHPSVMPIHDVVQESGCHFIVSEYIEGGNLLQRIRKSLPSTQQATQWALELSQALQHAHSMGIVHRDIKPANILIDHHERAILADFGIAQSAAKKGHFSPSVGTLKYMAPEQIAGGQADCRSDIYSLGLVLYEMLAGRLPYCSKNLHDLRKEIGAGVKINFRDLPKELRTVCEKALKCNPDDRYQDAESLVNALSDSLVSRRRSSGLSIIAVLVMLIAPLVLLIPSYFSSTPVPALYSQGVLAPKVSDDWVRRVSNLSGDQLVSEVIDELKRLNPDFSGDVNIDVEMGRVVMIDLRTDDVVNISPLSVFKDLRIANLSGTFGWKHNGRLADISPLRGLPIEQLDIHSTLVEDLSPLEGMPLSSLVANNTQITDLLPIRGAKLVRLDIHNTFISDLSPIVGMPIEALHIANTKIKDLTPLSGMPIQDLRCQYCGIADIGPLRGAPLQALEAHGNPIRDLSPLTNNTIMYLNIYRTLITDWSPIKTMPRLKMISFDFVKSRDSDLLRSIVTLEEINERSVDVFWMLLDDPEKFDEAVARGDLFFHSKDYPAAFK